MIKSKSKYLTLVKDINFNFIPNNLAFSTEMNRMYAETVLRQITADEIPSDPTFEKYFTWDRVYGFKYNPMKSVTIDFNAINNASIDEPEGRLDTEEKKDSLWNNIFDWDAPRAISIISTQPIMHRSIKFRSSTGHRRAQVMAQPIIGQPANFTATRILTES